MAESQEKNGSDLLYRLVSYAKDYINLVNPAISRYKIFTGDLPQNVINLSLLFSNEAVGEEMLEIDLSTFYGFTPKEILEQDKDTRHIYEEEKKIALKLEEISGKYKINEYTKQIVINFGFFTASYPIEKDIEEENDSVAIDGADISANEVDIEYEEKTYPLFSIPVEIVQTAGKYKIKLLDDRITTNFGFLNNILLEKNYFEFIEIINSFEAGDKFNIPLVRKNLDSLWESLKTGLRLSDAVFDDSSFSMDYSVISLSAKSNFFLSQDLTKLLSLKDADLLSTSLGSWIQGLNDIEKLTINESDGKDIFFPFEYNSYQKDILKLLPYKASIVEGPPGTGKSQTIANLLCHLAANNKKVLFLSQKPQALKVVKDKLRELDIKYLFGYIPDRYSTIYTDQEEADSAGSLLAGVSEYLNDFNSAKSPKNSNINESPSNFSEYISTEKNFTALYTKISMLEKYDIGLQNYSEFLNCFSFSTYEQMVETEKSLESTKSFCTDFVSKNSIVSTLNNIFNHIDFTQNYSRIIKEIIDEVSENYYDRSSKIGRFVKNKLFLGMKLRKYTQELPGEILEYFENITNRQIYKSEALVELNILKNYFLYKESLIRIDELNNRFKGFLLDTTMSSSNFAKAKELISTYGDDAIRNILDLYKAKETLRDLSLRNPNIINKNLTEVRQFEKMNVRHYINNRIRNRVITEFNSQAVKSIIAKIARSLKKSKRAYKTFDTLKSDPKNFITVSNIIPVWIMSLEDASRLIPLENGVFDYIVLDEASQCNLAYAIPAMFRAKHILFIGDSEQMRDDTIRFKSNKTLLSIAEKNKIPDELQIKGEGDSVKSVLDIGYLSGFEKSALLNHYRSPKEIIGFSNKYFYSPKGKNLNVINSNYLTYKDTNRVLVLHKVDTDRSEDEGSKSNYQEAVYIRRLINELKQDPKTKNKSIGVLTFFNEQALLLKKTIDDPNIKISIIEGIQGDERDIIIFSFVISDPSQKRKYIALTSEGGDINKSINEGRVNVAFSRARLQVHCVTSLETERWPEGIWIKKYLEYVQSEGLVNFYDKELKPFDSLFEEEFYYFVRNKLSDSYIIQNQVESCGFKIDFVITNRDTGQKLAIECDGPTHFEDEDSSIYVVSDLERQSVLESAGWAFYRVPYSRWIIEKDKRGQFASEIKEIFSDFGTATGANEPDHGLEKETIIESDTPVQTIYSSTTVEDTSDKVVDVDVDNNEFKELFRFEIDTQRTLVVSEMPSKEGIWLNEYLNKGNYVGYSSHGIGFKYCDTKGFINNAKETLKTGKESRLPWISGTHSELVITKIPSVVYKGKFIVDLRQYINSSRYTGFTKKGIRMNEDEFQSFISLLETKQLV